MSCKNPIALVASLAVAVALAANAQPTAPNLPTPLALPPAPVLKPISINGGGTISGNLSLGGGSGAIVNWDKFNISADGAIKFQQPPTSNAVLNRVLTLPAPISDKLSTNGQVELVNPVGILQLGGIKTPVGGNVYLTGTTETNNGITTTAKGEKILAAGATISLIDSATPGVKVEIIGAKNNTTNLEAIMANANRVGIAGAMVRDSARPSAPIVVNQGGRIFLQVGSSGLAPN